MFNQALLQVSQLRFIQPFIFLFNILWASTFNTYTWILPVLSMPTLLHFRLPKHNSKHNSTIQPKIVYKVRSTEVRRTKRLAGGETVGAAETRAGAAASRVARDDGEPEGVRDTPAADRAEALLGVAGQVGCARSNVVRCQTCWDSEQRRSSVRQTCCSVQED